MKTLKQLALFLLVGSSAFLTSCNPDDDVAPENKPTITISADSKTAAPGETVRLTINAAAEKQLRNVKVSVSAGGASAGTIMDTTFASGRNTSGAITYDYLIGNAANYTFTATVTDRDGVTATATETVTVSGTGSNFQLCPGVVLGSYNNTTVGSSFNSSNCAVLKAADARNAAASVDFVYFYGASNGATLAAPSDASFGTGANQIDFGVHQWNPRNPTKLKVLSGFNFDDATAANIQAALGSGDSKANNLKVGDIVGFETAGGKFGVARVNAISGGTAGTITLDVKTSK